MLKLREVPTSCTSLSFNILLNVKEKVESPEATGFLIVPTVMYASTSRVFKRKHKIHRGNMTIRTAENNTYVTVNLPASKVQNFLNS